MGERKGRGRTGEREATHAKKKKKKTDCIIVRGAGDCDGAGYPLTHPRDVRGRLYSRGGGGRLFGFVSECGMRNPVEWAPLFIYGWDGGRKKIQ